MPDVADDCAKIKARFDELMRQCSDNALYAQDVQKASHQAESEWLERQLQIATEQDTFRDLQAVAYIIGSIKQAIQLAGGKCQEGESWADAMIRYAKLGTQAEVNKIEIHARQFAAIRTK